jgi:hypothetical protein
VATWKTEPMWLVRTSDLQLILRDAYTEDGPGDRRLRPAHPAEVTSGWVAPWITYATWNTYATFPR